MMPGVGLNSSNDSGDFSPYVPEDFDAFWAEILAEANAVPLDFRRVRVPSHSFDVPHLIDEIQFASVGGVIVRGWIAFPDGARRAPGFVWVPPYGRESLLPNEYGTREGLTSLSLNLLGESAFHQEKYEVRRGYFAMGAADPESFIFGSMIQHVLVALRVFQAQSEVDEDRIGVMGLSQGGGMALWAAAQSEIVKNVCADLPFLGAMRFAMTRNAYRYPLKELVDFMATIPIGRERVMHTLSYFDTMNVATRVKVPALVSLGAKDPACRPEQVRAIYDAIPGEKHLIEYPGGHDWDPEMVGNNAEWLLNHLTA